jgi:glutathione S-transferase
MMTQRRVKGGLYGHGIGRHSEKEIYGIAERDLRAVSAYLGKKKFLFWNQPSLVDAVLFALVGNFIWFLPLNPQAKLIESDLKNLADHSKRMKETFYPDWDQIVTGKKKSD